ncbi:MAG TPA: hypothetical protein VKE51_39625 [Vicinamibacterales bacterium]|nr:hypothetical protein [Vicinamibacterales bacterium]
MSTPADPKTASAPRKRVPAGAALSRVQAIVGTLAGLATVAGVVFPLLQSGRPMNTGELVAIVETAGSRHTVTEATIEVATADNAIVATLRPDARGRATQELREGAYVVRISSPRYADDVRRIQLLPGQTIEIRSSLRPESPPSEIRSSQRAGSPSRVERAVDDGVSALRKALRF